MRSTQVRTRPSDEPLHIRLVELIRLHVGLEEDFAFNPVLAADQVPPLALPENARTDGAARLGRTSWLTAPKPRQRTAAEAILRPVVLEPARTRL